MSRHSVTIRRIGNSYGIILGKELLGALDVAEGDKLFAVRTPDGLRLTPYDADFVEAVESNRDYMRRHRNAMRELARR
jgi:putative addiction module antidote